MKYNYEILLDNNVLQSIVSKKRYELNSKVVVSIEDKEYIAIIKGILKPNNDLKNIIEKPDYIIEDNKHSNTLIFLKEIENIDKKGRIVVRLALGHDNYHTKNSIITLMKLNKRTWNQTIRNRGKIIWKAGQK